MPHAAGKGRRKREGGLDDKSLDLRAFLALLWLSFLCWVVSKWSGKWGHLPIGQLCQTGQTCVACLLKRLFVSAAYKYFI